MEFIQRLLEQSPLLTLFLVMGLGYAFGGINLRGLSLGVGAVLFVGLAIGAFAPKSPPPGLIGTIGLVMFLYGIGIQYGQQFVEGLTGAAGRRYNLLMVICLAFGAIVTVAAIYALGIKPAYAAGLFAGSMTSTPTLQAAIETTGNKDPTVGYSVAYPFGVIGPILLIQL